MTESRPAEDFLVALSDIGVRFEDLKALAQRGEYEEIFRRLGDAGLDAATAISLFGTEGFSAGANLSESISKVDALTESLIGAEGWAEQMRLIQEQGLPGAIAAFKSALEGLQLELGSAGLTNWLAAAADALRGFVLWLRDASGWVKTTMAIVLASGPVLLGLAVFLKLVTFALSGLVPLLKLAAWANTKFGISAKFAAFWNSNFILSLRLAAISVTGFAVRLWTRGTAALGRFATSVRTNAIPALSRFAATIWTSTIGALRALGRRLAMASLAMLRFAGRAIVAGIAGVAAFAAAIWTGAVPALAAFAAGVWATTVAMLANPVGLIVLGIVGLIAALVLLVKHWDTVTDALEAVWRFVKNNWQEVAGLLLLPILGPFALIATNAFGLRDKLMGVFLSIRDFFMGIWGTIVGIFRDHWAKILAVIFPAVGIPLLIAQEWDQIVGIVGGIWNRVYDTVKGWIEAIISFIKEIPGKVKDAVKDIPNMVTDAVKEIPVVGQVLDVVGGAADKAKGLLGGIGNALGLAEGGIVPGPLGRPLLATVHGGEMILPPSARQVLLDMFEGFRLGPDALPQAPHYCGQMYRSSVDNRSVTVHIHEPIVIHTEATDAKGIAQELDEAIQDQIRNVAYDHDGPVER